MANESSAGIGLPSETAAPAPEASSALKVESSQSGKWGWLKFWGKRSAPAKQEGPIPGVTPASPDQLFGQSGPKITLPSEQVDISTKEVESVQKVA